MAQVIIYQNPNGTNVCVCTPSNDSDINLVLKNDCPEGAIIVDDSTLPQGDDANYFDAWVLNNGVVTVDLAKKQDIIDSQTASSTAKSSALAKLTALGLTQTEVNALIK